MNNKNVLWLVISLAVIAVIVVVVVLFSGQSDSITDTDDDTQATSTSTGTDVPEGRPHVGGAAVGLTYTQAILQYEGKRMQLDLACQAQPNYLVFKNGTKVMIDNRSNQARRITIGGKAYDLGPYEFEIVTLSATTFPQTQNVDCGNSQNVGRFLIER